MKVLTVYVKGKLQDKTIEALYNFMPYDAELDLREVSDGHAQHSPEYHNIIAEVWNLRQGVVIVEQDNVIRSGVIQELWDCSEDWCGFTYNIGGVEHKECLGCTKFSQKLMVDNPDLMERAGEIKRGCPEKCWHKVDGMMVEVLRARGYTFHAHTPSIEHLHTY